jgi:predicted TIM-barrel fold metal-dependent hydrolase
MARSQLRLRAENPCRQGGRTKERFSVNQILPKANTRTNAFAGVKVVDVDTHWSEPMDLWTSRAPSSLKDLVPQVHMKDGARWWYIDGKPFGPTQHSSALRKDGVKLLGMGFWDLKFEDVHESSHDIKARLEMMDATGIHAQIVYPNVLGFGNTRASEFSPAARLAATQIYNDAAAEMQEISGGRFLPMTLVPWWDINEAVKEIRRCHAMGLRGINTNSDPQEAGLPDLGDVFWDPMWEVCSELNLPINFHIGSSQSQNMWFGQAPWKSMGSDEKLVAGGTMLFAGNGKVITNIILSGLLERFPKLQFVSVESGIGWIPFLLESLDYSMTQVNITSLSMSPTEYFRRNFSACFWFEKLNVRNVADLIGVDNIMWESDYPHPTCLFPDALEVAAESLAKFTPDEQRKILGGNAARIYNIPL